MRMGVGAAHRFGGIELQQLLKQACGLSAQLRARFPTLPVVTASMILTALTSPASRLGSQLERKGCSSG